MNNWWNLKVILRTQGKSYNFGTCLGMLITNLMKISIFLSTLSAVIVCDDVINQPRCSYVFFLGKPMNTSKCLAKHICDATFEVSYVVNYEAYHYLRLQLVRQILGRCCGACAKMINSQNVTNITDLKPQTDRSPHFTFPVLAPKHATEMYGYYFIPVMNAPGVIYVSRKKSSTVFGPIIDLYPLLVVCLLMALISGFVIWVCESCNNKDEFPREFFIGWFEGIWFSIVTMTTVGYGDRTPKSVAGKLFGISWIFIGIILSGLMAASLTSEILKANSPPPPNMKGKKVGMIKYRDYEGYVIARHGGFKVEVDGTNLFNVTFVLINKLQSNKIDGFLLDKRTFYYLSIKISERLLNGESKDRITEMEYFMHKTKRTEQNYEGPDICYGLLVKLQTHYKFFLPILRDNQFVIERLNEEAWNHHMKNETYVRRGSFYSTSTILFSPGEKYFQNTLLVSLLMIGSIILFGVFYELFRKFKLAQSVYVKKSILERFANNFTSSP